MRSADVKKQLVSPWQEIFDLTILLQVQGTTGVGLTTQNNSEFNSTELNEISSKGWNQVKEKMNTCVFTYLLVYLVWALQELFFLVLDEQQSSFDRHH